VSDFPSKLLSKLNPNQIREALQPSHPKAAQIKSVTGQPQQSVDVCVVHIMINIDHYIIGIP